MEVELTKQKGPMGVGEGKAYDGDVLVASGVTFMVG